MASAGWMAPGFMSQGGSRRSNGSHVSSGQGGLGWFIFENLNFLDIPAVFAGLLTVIVIGLIVENLIFRTIERNTVQKWGTQS